MKALIPSDNLSRFFRFHFILLLAVLFSSLTGVAVSAEKNKAAKPKDIKRLFEKHCYRCHNDEKQKGDIRLDNIKLDFARERGLWDKIEEQIITNKMPDEKPFLSTEQRLKITDWINDQKGKVDWSSHRRAGHVTLPMLNRDEYENTNHFCPWPVCRAVDPGRGSRTKKSREA